jgi:hypothetical protein
MTYKRKAGNPRVGKRVISGGICLTPDRWEKAKALGEGCKSKGVAKALDNHKLEDGK